MKIKMNSNDERSVLKSSLIVNQIELNKKVENTTKNIAGLLFQY